MRTLSIFDGGFTTYPKIFKKVKPVLNMALLTIKKFCLVTDKKFFSGSINSLKNNLGIKVDGIPTFKTPYISGNKGVIYNGYYLSLTVKKDVVSLVVGDGNNSLDIDCWELKSITKVLDVKNVKCNFITNQFVEDLIMTGKLTVQFRVGTDKNHGTYWKLN